MPSNERHFLLFLRNDVKAAKKQSNCAHGVRCIGYIPVVFSSLVHLKVPEQILHAVFRTKWSVCRCVQALSVHMPLQMVFLHALACPVCLFVSVPLSVSVYLSLSPTQKFAALGLSLAHVYVHSFTSQSVQLHTHLYAYIHTYTRIYTNRRCTCALSPSLPPSLCLSSVALSVSLSFTYTHHTQRRKQRRRRLPLIKLSAVPVPVSQIASVPSKKPTSRMRKGTICAAAIQGAGPYQVQTLKASVKNTISGVARSRIFPEVLFGM